MVHIPSLSEIDNVNYPRLPTCRSEATNANRTVIVGSGESEDYSHDILYAPYTIENDLGVTPYGETIEIESDHFTVVSDGASMCYGDHGAPLVNLHAENDCSPQDVILGISSWSTGSSCYDDGVAAFVDVLTYSTFIRDAMSGSIEPAFQLYF